MAAADEARGLIAAALSHDSEVDLAAAVVGERLTPVRVHEHHTASTDWLGDVTTDAPEGVSQEMIAQGSVWYSRLSDVVKTYPDELAQQALGMARRLAGKFGAGADAAEATFLSHVGDLHSRDVTAGLITVVAAAEPPTQGPSQPSGLPLEETTSERAQNMQVMENNTSAGGDSGNGWPSPLELPQQDVDAANGDSGTQQDHARTASNDRKEASMQTTAACPECSGCSACGGTHRVAVRVQGASGLDQVDQTVDPHDSPKATPYPTDVAFPWEMANDSGQAISEAEGQIAQREQLKGASLVDREALRQEIARRAAKKAAESAYLRVMSGQDDSGWMGDNGAGGVRPGMQDAGNPGNTYPGNITDADPVYGQGGDNGNQPLKPFGADEANDYTNDPGMNLQPGAPLQYDQAGRANQVGQPTAARVSDDPEIERALRFVRERRALLAQRGQPA